MKRVIPLILVVALLLSACSAREGAQTAQAGGNSIQDGAGRTLIIPENKDETTIATVYAVSVPFIVALGLSERVLAVNVKSKFWTNADDALAKAGSVGRGAVDLEALAELSPSVLIHRSNDPQTVESVTDKLGINVLCVTVEALEDIRQTLVMMGEYFGREERASEVCSWLDTKFNLLNELTSDIGEGERKTALVMGGELGRVAGGDMLQSYLIECAGGASVSADVRENRNWVNVGVETVFGWNPDYIFLTSSTPLDYTIKSIMDDPVWSDLSAVQNGHIYQLPAKIDSWDMPGISCPLAAMYMLYRMYPDRMSRETLEAEIDGYYEFMFGRGFDTDYLGIELGD